MGGPRNSLNMNCIFLRKAFQNNCLQACVKVVFQALVKKRLTIKKKRKVWLKITRLVCQLAGQP